MSQKPVIEVIAIKFDTVTASVTGMRHVFMLLTLTFIQGHTYFDYENNKCSIISETVQAMPIKFAMKTVRLEGLCNLCESDDLDLHTRSQPRLKLDILFNLQFSSNISDDI